jgi:hypothetical protein
MVIEITDIKEVSTEIGEKRAKNGVLGAPIFNSWKLNQLLIRENEEGGRNDPNIVCTYE